jgi:hypothetical protein
MKKILTGLASFTLVLGSIESATAQLRVLDSTAGPLSIYDQGGLLNSTPDPVNYPRGYHISGLEVAVDGSGVYFTQGDAPPAHDYDARNDPFYTVNNNRFMKSTGMGTAVQVGASLPVGNWRSWGNDLTYNQYDGYYYIATSQGIYGFNPAGGPAKQFARGSNTNRVTASGLTFTDNGNKAILSSDWPKGLWLIPKGGTTQVQASYSMINPVAPAWDDHVITKDGSLVLIGDSNDGLFQAMPDRSIKAVYKFENDPNYPNLKSYLIGGYGSRGAVDPISGDIFYGLTFDTRAPVSSIIRIKSDYSTASVFATGLVRNLRDFDFGPSSSGKQGDISLYIAELDQQTQQGVIYEVAMGSTMVPEPPPTMVTAIIALGFGAWLLRKFSDGDNFINK